MLEEATAEARGVANGGAGVAGCSASFAFVLGCATPTSGVVCDFGVHDVGLGARRAVLRSMLTQNSARDATDVSRNRY
jgi:hypothetical protein